MQNRVFIILGFLLTCFSPHLPAQSNLFTGTQNRVVVFARFNGDPEIDTPRSSFESMFNGENNSFRSYFKAVSNNQLMVNSLMYPQNSGVNDSYELKYCYYCYDNSWKGTYPDCKGNDITSLFDINIGFIIKELVAKLEESGNLPDASTLDGDNDGCIDNFVIIFRGAARGANKGIYSPQVGKVSSTFINANGQIQLKGKTIQNYTITYERNSLDTHCRFLLEYMGFPVQYRYASTLARTVGAWDPMDGPLLSYPLVYNRMKYTNGNWIDNIPQITEPGVYSLSPVGSATNYAYKILSSDSQQYWVLEYRDKSAAWDTNLPESGLIIYRVNTNYTGSLTTNPEVYLYRKNGTFTEAGNINNAPFSDLNGRTLFNSGSNPVSFLSNGTISDDIDISDIRFDNGKISFRVNKAYTSLNTVTINDWKACFVSGTHVLQLQGEGMEQLIVTDISGRILGNYSIRGLSQIELPGLNPGVYLAVVKGESGTKIIKINP